MRIPRTCAFDRINKVLLQSALIAIALAIASSKSWATEPSSAFLERKLCTVWAGQCQPYSSTVGQLANRCRANSSVEWEIGRNNQVYLRCRGRDQLTGQSTMMAFGFSPYDNGNERFASVSGLAVNGITLSSAQIVNLISNIDSDLVEQSRKNEPRTPSQQTGNETQTTSMWQPRREILDAPIHMMIENELRNTFIRPRDIAEGCAKWLKGHASYRRLSGDGFDLVCNAPPKPDAPLSTMNFTISKLPVTQSPVVALMGISASAQSSATQGRKLSDAEQFQTMKEIRDNLLDDDVIKDIEEGQDAFSKNGWRLCKNRADTNCMPQSN